MCEQCEARRARNIEIRRALADRLYADEAPAPEIPGYADFIALARQMEQLSRNLLPGAIDVADADRFRASILALSPEGRTNVTRIAAMITEMASAIRNNVGEAKVYLRDTDGTTIAVLLEGNDIVVRVNGEETQRIQLAPGQNAEEALDAAERAMVEHRATHHPESE